MIAAVNTETNLSIDTSLTETTDLGSDASNSQLECGETSLKARRTLMEVELKSVSQFAVVIRLTMSKGTL